MGILKVCSLLALTIHRSDLVNFPSDLDSTVLLGIFTGLLLVLDPSSSPTLWFHHIDKDGWQELQNCLEII